MFHANSVPAPPHITKQVHRERAFYHIQWSVLEPVSRHTINSRVPSLPGIWELYYLENSRIPRMLKMGRAWYGGLRNVLRLESDGSELQNRDMQELLESGDSYYRYTVCEIAADLEEVYDVLTTLRGVPSPPAPPQRYREVRIQEPEEMSINRNRTPAQPKRPPTPFGNRVPNMFDAMRAMQEIEDERNSRS
ncbi:hypothetical protein [Spirochaeta africana]|uniref:Uncharacterized protein n=1 Tax=Spirochaeta africana (strain ATCC 700263 / DSM 8902 / Z-7692) TaxID=889378 RepID=H9UFH7_SPIAZ|nr:hypothetical protein [Spirochaeta africana]AFG36270.1 hypothetical protein Spiaf_0161 [Spirochaeta africana DSM 8902]